MKIPKQLTEKDFDCKSDWIKYEKELCDIEGIQYTGGLKSNAPSREIWEAEIPKVIERLYKKTGVKSGGSK